MKEEQKYNGSKTRNYFTAYLLASIRGKRLRYLEKQQKILFAEENLEDKEYTDADISPEERLELEQKEQLLMEEAQDISRVERNDGYKPYRSHVFFAGRRTEAYLSACL